MGFCELLTLVFVGCKLAGVVTWAWWVVFIPMYPALVFYGIFLIISLYLLLMAILGLSEH